MHSTTLITVVPLLLAFPFPKEEIGHRTHWTLQAGSTTGSLRPIGALHVGEIHNLYLSYKEHDRKSQSCQGRGLFTSCLGWMVISRKLKGNDTRLEAPPVWHPLAAVQCKASSRSRRHPPFQPQRQKRGQNEHLTLKPWSW